MPLGAPLVGALLFPRLPSPHTPRPRGPHQFPVHRAKPAQTCYSISMTQNTAPLQNARPPVHPGRQDKIFRSPLPRPVQPRTALSHGPKVATQTAKDDFCRLADDIGRQKSTGDAGGDVLSRAAAQMSCHERKKSCPEKSTLDDIGRQMSTSDTLSIPFPATSPPAAHQAAVRHTEHNLAAPAPKIVEPPPRGRPTIVRPIVVRPICAIIASDAS